MEGVGDRLWRVEDSQRVRDWTGQAEALDRSLGHVLCLRTVRIECVVAAAPTQFGGERGDKVEENPGDYDHVINGDICYYQQRTIAQSCAREEGENDVRVFIN